MLYIGVDPGEAWCGFAALDITSEGIVRVEARTYKIAAHDGYLQMARDLINLLPHSKKTHLTIEDFRIRRSGHQSFSRGETLRFIGALEFGCEQLTMFTHSVIPPSDHGDRETKELFGRVLINYRKQWPKPRHPAWGHCVSAWRVLGHSLMQHEREVLITLRKGRKKSHRIDRWLPATQLPGDCVAPAAWWMK